MNKVKNILSHFGDKKQILKAKEELTELLQALDSGNSENIIEEIADAEVMLEQLKYIYDCVYSVEIIKQCKINRTLKIINGECTVPKKDRPQYCGKKIWACTICDKNKKQ